MKKKIEIDASMKEFIGNVKGIMLITDTHGDILHSNPFADDFFGYAPGELTGKIAAGSIAPAADRGGAPPAGLRELISDGPESSAGTLTGNMRKNGERVLVSWMKSPIRDDNGEVVGFLCMGHGPVRKTAHATTDDAAVRPDDGLAGLNATLEKRIMELEEAGRELRVNEERYRVMLEDQRELICRTNAEGKLLYMNQAYCRFFNIPREKLLGMSFHPLTPPETLKGIQENLSRLTVNAPFITHRHQVEMKGSDIQWMEWTDRAIFDDKGKVVEYQSVGRDITGAVNAQESINRINEGLENRVRIRTGEINSTINILLKEVKKHKKTADALKDSKTFIDNLVKKVNCGIFLMEDSLISYANPWMSKHTGYTAEELQSIKVWMLALPAHRTSLKSFVTEQLTDNRRSARYEFPISTKKGQVKWCDVSFTPVKTDKGSALMGLMYDVTDYKRIESSLRESEEKCRSLIENLNVWVFRTQPQMNGGFIVSNSTQGVLLGYDSMEELAHMRVSECYYRPAERKEIINEIIRNGSITDREVRFRKKDGSLIWVSITAKAERDRKGKVRWIGGIVQDITERKEYRDRLAESENKFRLLFENSSQAQLLIDDYRFIDCNDAALRLLGCPSKELLVNLKPSDLSPEVQPDGVVSAEKEIKIIEKAHREKSIRFEWVHKKFKGGEFPAEVILTSIPYQGRHILHTSWTDITHRRRVEKEIMYSIENERRKLGQDLHDDLGQQLTGISFLLKTAADRFKKEGVEDFERIEYIRNKVIDAMSSTRTIVKGLCPVDISSESIIHELRSYAREIESIYGVSCLVECGDEVMLSNPMLATQIFYIIKEAINNAAKHGKPTRIQASLAVDASRTVLRIIDNGTGMKNNTDGRKGLGLNIMKYRAESLGGSFTMKENRPKGTVIECIFMHNERGMRIDYEQKEK